MGGSDDQTEGSWIWSADGSELVYTNWYPNEPNHSDGENCLKLSALYHWHWNDANCKKVLFQFICEKGAVGLKPIIGQNYQEEGERIYVQVIQLDTLKLGVRYRSLSIYLSAAKCSFGGLD
ncbi:Hypothetical predicted protein [Mytilus galloprovincialis]|uniref:C-type lectin domain-containing protein n=1 Tax=Mytilus galloprovincialis TaxID=29158 RepID=A0A8B6GHE3_MYTGA|nr:Hypothetical predicted protein [Mytilus galloprovincialis]